ncbi:MAG: ferritin-like domain-containing protein [Bdellovibrionales bacterium]|nr:ferritin-like domain-containing protein [Bdellovibrionales bacterium]
MEKSYNNKEVLDLLGEIYKKEIAGVNRYLHFSFMIMGYNRIPIQKWFRENAQEAMEHAIEIGEKITSCGGHPPIASPQVEEMGDHSIQQLLEESLKGEEDAVALYKELASLAEKIQDIPLEEMARNFVKIEVEHVDEVRKMLVKSR